VDAPWLSVSPTNGTLTGDATTNVLVSLDDAASNLFVGDYTAQVTLTNMSTGMQHYRSFTLQISDPLTLSPAAGFEFGGSPSGPFNVDSEALSVDQCQSSRCGLERGELPAWLSVFADQRAVGA